MKGIFNRANAPYVVAGSLATLVLLTSGVFAVAPHIALLDPVAALDFGLPFIISCAVLSFIIIGLSYIAANQNNVIVDQTAEIEAKKKALADKTAEIEVKKEELTRKTAEIETQAKNILTNPKSTISCKHSITASIACADDKLLLNLDEEQKELVRKSKNPGKKGEYLLYIRCDKGIFRITGTYDDNFPINSVANQDGSDVQDELTEMQAKLGVSTTSKNIEIEIELKIEGKIHNSNIRIEVKSVLDPTTVSNAITTSNSI